MSEAKQNLEALGPKTKPAVKSAQVYGMKQFSGRERELVITAILAATGAFPDGMVEHARLAAKEGATPGQLDELFSLVAAYAPITLTMTRFRRWPSNSA